RAKAPTSAGEYTDRTFSSTFIRAIREWGQAGLHLVSGLFSQCRYALRAVRYELMLRAERPSSRILMTVCFSSDSVGFSFGNQLNAWLYHSILRSLRLWR